MPLEPLKLLKATIDGLETCEMSRSCRPRADWLNTGAFSIQRKGAQWYLAEGKELKVGE